MRLRLVLSVAALALLAAPAAQAATKELPGCAPRKSAGGEWRSFGHDNANTRSQPNEKVISPGDAPTLTSAWVFSSVANGGAGDFTGTPVVTDGCMYMASTRGWVFAVNADSGKLVWKAQLPYGGSANNTVGIYDRTVPRKPKRRKRKWTKAGTLYVAATRTQKSEGCPPGDPCIGPYVAAFDQKTGKLAFATPSIDSQPGADVYGSPVFHNGLLLMGVSGGSAELGDEADRYAFQGSMNFIDTRNGRVLKKTWTIHAPKAPDDEFAGAGVWSTPAIDHEGQVAYAGTSNPFKPQAEHPYANSVVKYDINRRSPRFGQIIGHYKGNVDEYFPGLSEAPCYDIPGNAPPYYPQGIGACGDIDLDFGASPNLFKDEKGRKLVGAGQKSGVYHVFDAKTMEPVWKQVVGPAGALGGVVGSTAYDGKSVYGPITAPGYLWSLDAKGGSHRWFGPIADGAHWGPPVAVANGLVYSVDFSGFLDVFDARSGVLLVRRPLALGGGGPQSISWAGVSIARNTVYAAVGVLGLADGFVVAFRPGSPADLVADVRETPGGGGGGGGPSAPAGPSIAAGPGAASVGYATPVMVTQVGGPLSFLNLDVVQHDVVAEEKGPDGRPVFSTKLIGLGETAPVEGLDKVQAGGSYPFYCSLHPGMRGTLSVN